MAVTVYRSTDTSAPTLSGTVGDLVNVLDKCLVAGYGSKTAAGWTKPFTGTNTAVFRMGGGNQFYIDVNDNGPGAGGGQEARVRGYEVMTAVGTGTGLFPTVAQVTNGLIVRKSAAASGTTRVWTVVADDRTFYLFIQAGDSAGLWYCFMFGDFYSYTSGTDNFRALIVGRQTENSATVTVDTADAVGNTLNSANSAHYLTRSYTGLGGSVTWANFVDAKGSQATSPTKMLGVLPFPNAADGKVWISPCSIVESVATLIRGKIRGFFFYMHPLASFNDQDTVTGSGVYAGHTFLLFKTTGNAAAYCIDITGPWDTN